MRSRKTIAQKTNPITGEVTSIVRFVPSPLDDPDRIVYPPDVCPPLVSESDFKSVQQRLVQNKAFSSRNLKRPQDVLIRTPLGQCGWCGATLTAAWNINSQEYYFRCSHQSNRRPCPAPHSVIIASKKLDAAIWSWFTDQMLHPERLREQYHIYLANVAALANATDSQRSAVEAAQEQALSEEQNYLAAVGSATSDVMRDRFVLLAEEAHERVVSLAATFDDLAVEEDRRREQEKIIIAFQEAAPMALLKLENASMEERRMVLYQFAVRAVLWGKKHTPYYQFHWIFDDLCSDPSWQELAS